MNGGGRCFWRRLVDGFRVLMAWRSRARVWVSPVAKTTVNVVCVYRLFVA